MSDADPLIQPRRRGDAPDVRLAKLPDENAARALPGVQLAAVGLWKRYHKGRVEIPVLRGVDLEVRRGEFLSIMGQSGSGKSTLLHLLGLLDVPDEGEVCFQGRRIDHLPMRQLDVLRNKKFGMIFQFYHLLPELSALENVLSPLLIAESVFGYLRRRKQHVARARYLLELVGLGHRLKHRPCELSGGEMQRAAIARALAAGPEVLLADEPTGNLDSQMAGSVMDLLDEINASGTTIIMVTHELELAKRARRNIFVRDGHVSDGSPDLHLATAAGA